MQLLWCPAACVNHDEWGRSAARQENVTPVCRATARSRGTTGGSSSTPSGARTNRPDSAAAFCSARTGTGQRPTAPINITSYANRQTVESRRLSPWVSLWVVKRPSRVAVGQRDMSDLVATNDSCASRVRVQRDLSSQPMLHEPSLSFSPEADDAADRRGVLPRGLGGVRQPLLLPRAVREPQLGSGQHPCEMFLTHVTSLRKVKTHA